MTTNSSVKSKSYNTSGYIPNKNKPDDFDFSNFFIWAAVVIVAIFLISLLGNSSNNSPSSTSNIQVSPTPIQKNESCNIDFKYFTPKQLCETYWSKTVTHHHTCNIAISKELGDRGFYSFPEEKCGRKTIDSSLPANGATDNKAKNPQSGSSENFSDKVNKLATEYGSNTLSFDLVKNNPENIITYNQIIKEIVNKFKDSDKNTEIKDGLIVHKQINLPYISKVVWYASENDTCNNKTLGTKEICLLGNGAAICQPIELNLNYKSLCVESFAR